MKCPRTQIPTQKTATHDHSKTTEKKPEENSMSTVITAVSGDIKKPNAERRSETTNTVNNTQTTTGTDEMGQGTTETMTVITPGTDDETIVIHGTINPNTIKNWSVKSAAIPDIQRKPVINAPKGHLRIETFHTINRTSARTTSLDENSNVPATLTLRIS